MKNLIIILSILTIAACSKQNCIDNYIGTYKGLETCGLSQAEGTITITNNQNNSLRLELNDAELSYIGDITDCNTIVIPNQSILIGSQNRSVEGQFTIEDNNLTGTMSYFGLANCSYDLVRQ